MAATGVEFSINLWFFWQGATEAVVQPRPKLTPRQFAFLEKLLELYRETHRPVHYSAVAARLGVNRFSAYDMLKVLEQKGCVASSYALEAGHSGPGRSMVVFAPAAQAGAVYPAGASDRPNDQEEEWQSVRERVLNRLREAREADHREVLSDLLERLPEAKAPLAYCTEMIGVLLLNMRRVKARAGQLSPFRTLAALWASNGTALETLAGLSVGATLSVDDEPEFSLTHKLLDPVHRYQVALARLSEEGRSALVQFLQEALEALD
jgi:hypothetical protein